MKETIEAVVRSHPSIVDPAIEVGKQAPDFKLLTPDMQEVRLSDSKGKFRLLNVVYSHESHCDLQTQKFLREATRFKDVAVYTLCINQPSAQARRFGHIKSFRALSGENYELLIKGHRMPARAIIIDRDDVVRYVEYVKDASRPPDHTKAIEALKQLTSPPVYAFSPSPAEVHRGMLRSEVV
jgi:thioredoxin-dependent peroxiredoxin